MTRAEDASPERELDVLRALLAKARAGGPGALDRRDSTALVNFLRHAAEMLLPDEPRRYQLLQDANEELGSAGDFAASLELAQEIETQATALGDGLLAGRARLTGSLMRFWLEPEFGASEMLAAIGAEQEVFQQFAFRAGIARAHDYRALVYVYLGRFEAAEAEAREAIAGFEGVGDRRLAVEQLWYLTWTATMGPLPVSDAVRQCHGLLLAAGDDPAVEGHARYALGRLEARRGQFEEARSQVDEAAAIFERMGMVFRVWQPLHRAEIEILAGERAAAERELRRALEVLEPMGLVSDLTIAASRLADLLVDDGRLDEAREMASRAEAWAPRDQPIEGARWRASMARVLARGRGRSRADALARQAVRFAARTDYLDLQGVCSAALGDVLLLAGNEYKADVAFAAAIARYEQKGNVAAISRLRERLAVAGRKPRARATR